MGIPVLTLFGDKSEAEILKELEKVDAEMTKLATERVELVKVLAEVRAKNDCSTEG